MQTVIKNLPPGHEISGINEVERNVPSGRPQLIVYTGVILGAGMMIGALVVTVIYVGFHLYNH